MGIIGRILMSSVTVAATATPIPATALVGRKSIIIKNNGTATVYLGSSAVATTTGYPLGAGQELSFDIGDGVVLYGIVASSTNNVRIIEAV